MIHSIIYVSTVVGNLCQDDILSILEQARLKNNAQGISGFLVYNDHNFLQLLEGEAHKVQSLYALIQEDDRHRNILKILSHNSEKRAFNLYHDIIAAEFTSYHDRETILLLKDYVKQIKASANAETNKMIYVVDGILASM